MGGIAYNTISALGRQAGEIAGVKGGNNWMREKFGWDPTLSFHPRAGGAMGFGKAFQEGGFLGLGQQAKRWFGFGFDPRRGAARAAEYMPTLWGGPSALTRFRGRSVSGLTQMKAGMMSGAQRTNMAAALREERAFMRGSADIFRRRRIAGGVGLALGAYGISQTVGLGNVATMGIGMGGGAILGGAIGYGAMGSKAALAAQQGGAAAGRRIGGKIGLGVAGLGLITGIL
jgi:hypothetical protein